MVDPLDLILLMCAFICLVGILIVYPAIEQIIEWVNAYRAYRARTRVPPLAPPLPTATPHTYYPAPEGY
jgi:predicted PurR-regulated permease PerM